MSVVLKLFHSPLAIGCRRWLSSICGLSDQKSIRQPLFDPPEDARRIPPETHAENARIFSPKNTLKSAVKSPRKTPRKQPQNSVAKAFIGRFTPEKYRYFFVENSWISGLRAVVRPACPADRVFSWVGRPVLSGVLSGHPGLTGCSQPVHVLQKPRKSRLLPCIQGI